MPNENLPRGYGSAAQEDPDLYAIDPVIKAGTYTLEYGVNYDTIRVYKKDMYGHMLYKNELECTKEEAFELIERWEE